MEASPTDLVWGAGVKMYDSGRDIQGTWKGKNWLGFFVDRSKGTAAGGKWRCDQLTAGVRQALL